MQYIETKSDGVHLSGDIPVGLLSEAISLIESTQIVNGTSVEIMLHEGYLSLDGEGEVDNVDPLVEGLNMLSPYVQPGSCISIEQLRWETIVTLESVPPCQVSHN